jgi:hypothetical protein
MEWTGVDRRGSSERMKVGRPVSIFAGERQGILRARTMDLSTGGMRLDVGGGLGIGEHILFRIDLGEGFDPAVQGGEVVWSDGDGGTGVRFLAAEEVSTPRLEEKPPALPAEGDPVKLHIDSMDHPLRVRCVEAGSSGLVVSSELPFLERGRGVRAVFSGPAGGDSEVEGILSSIVLDEESGPVPLIKIRIRTGDEEPEPVGAVVEQDCPGDAGEPEEGASCDGDPAEDGGLEDREDDEWEADEPTERDALPPPEADEEPVPGCGEPVEHEDAMSDAFGSLT